MDRLVPYMIPLECYRIDVSIRASSSTCRWKPLSLSMIPTRCSIYMRPVQLPWSISILPNIHRDSRKMFLWERTHLELHVALVVLVDCNLQGRSQLRSLRYLRYVLSIIIRFDAGHSIFSSTRAARPMITVRNYGARSLLTAGRAWQRWLCP